MEEKKRKSSRSFELEKGGKRSFDLNKTSARKFDLAKESDEVSLEELKKELLADGKIDAEEVNKLHEVLYADGKIEQEEADFLFELNDAVSGKPNDSSWNQFFVEAISDYLLNDEKSPGVIDDEEGKWLVEKIGADGQVDGVEKELLTNLKKKAKSMPSSVISLIDGGKNQPTPSNPVPPTPLPPDGGDDSSGKWKKYAAILAGLVVLGGGGYYLSQQGNDTDAQSVSEVVEGQASGAEITDENKASHDNLNQEADTSDDAAAEAPAGDTPAEDGNSPAGDAPAIGENSPAVGTPSNASPSTAEPKKEDATSPAASRKISAPKADAPAKVTPSKPANQTKADIASPPTDPSASGTIEEEAINVIRGKYGNGDIRKRNLGGRYAEIQSKVNEMYRNGQVN